ncbi:MAG: NPCBM/NEW2 domain-containing protein [Acutalibacteraceae bacterium]
MICKSCGRHLPDGQIICPCGGRSLPTMSFNMSQTSEIVYADAQKNTSKQDYMDFFPPEETVTVSPENSEKKKHLNLTLTPKMKRILIILATACILVGTASVVIFAVTRPSAVQNFMTAWNDKDYTTAVTLYNDSISGSDTAVSELCEQIKDHLNGQKQSFISYKLDYGDLSNEITALEMLEIKSLSGFLDGFRNEIVQIRQSHNAFVNAQKYYDIGDYPSAVSEYKNVIEADTANYDTAQEQIKASIFEYKKICYAEAEQFITDGDFENAVKSLNKVLKLDENDEETIGKIQTYNENYITKTLNKASSLANDGKYLDAAELLNAANELVPDDRFTSKSKSYMEQYENSVVNSARMLADNQDYIGALRLLEENNKKYPSEVFNSAIQQYQDILYQSAKQLYELTPAVKNRIVIKDKTPVTDTYGGTYTGCVRFTTKANAEVEYVLDKNYIYISGYITAGNQTGLVASMNIQIYVDDELVFSQDNITRFTNPIPFNISLLDAQSLKIVTSSNSNNALDYLYLVNTIIY